MTTLIVQMPLPGEWDRTRAERAIEESAPMMRAAPGLVRSVSLLSMENRTWGGAFLWQSRREAESFCSPEYRAYLHALCGAKPVVQFFESPLILENVCS